jgi:hypothetical protein
VEPTNDRELSLVPSASTFDSSIPPFSSQQAIDTMPPILDNEKPLSVLPPEEKSGGLGSLFNCQWIGKSLFFLFFVLTW